MQHGVKLAVELGCERPLVEHGQITGILPVLLGAQLALDPIVEGRAGQRIAHRHADVVGLAIAHHLQGLLDVRARLAGIAELQEKGHLNAGGVQAPAGLVDLLDGRAFLHGVQDLLRAGLGADPDDLAAGPPQRVDLPRAPAGRPG